MRNYKLSAVLRALRDPRASVRKNIKKVLP
jgi:hypothetical protein